MQGRITRFYVLCRDGNKVLHTPRRCMILLWENLDEEGIVRCMHVHGTSL
jgi:hypothetical protein